MREFARQGINFTFVKISDACNKMIPVMEENYKAVDGNLMTVTDLASAC
jgi:hypothetical protein